LAFTKDAPEIGIYIQRRHHYIFALQKSQINYGAGIKALYFAAGLFSYLVRQGCSIDELCLKN
jgi:hypothetical protein